MVAYTKKDTSPITNDEASEEETEELAAQKRWQQRLRTGYHNMLQMGQEESDHRI
jgi:hypothetical protein